MAFTPRQRRRANRSNAYSKSKCTNWARFDPYQGEISNLPKNLEPTRIYEIADGESCAIYERPLHKAFLRPYDSDDVIGILDGIPRNYLKGLKAIYLLGGTWKQDKVAFGRMTRLGCHVSRQDESWIYLCAFPKDAMVWQSNRLPKPHNLQEYMRAGARLTQTREGWRCEFNEKSLKKFFLYDVLIHEIGHHADRHNFSVKTYGEEESFAEWFVREYGFRRSNG